MGNHKYIETPEKMWDLFKGYMDLVKSHPLRKHDFVGKDGDSVHRDLERPLTMEGFRAYGYQNEVTIKNYFDNQNGSYDEFYTVCTRIKEVIRADQIEGGMAGIYNPSITQRLNGLVEKTEQTMKQDVPVYENKLPTPLNEG